MRCALCAVSCALCAVRCELCAVRCELCAVPYLCVVRLTGECVDSAAEWTEANRLGNRLSVVMVDVAESSI